MTPNKTTALLIAYVICGFLTFGHVFNMSHLEVRCDKVLEVRFDRVTDRCVRNEFDMGPTALLAGTAWPIYWGGHFAIKVTK